LCIPWPEFRKTAINSVAVPAYLIATLQIAAAIQDVFRSMSIRLAAAYPRTASPTEARRKSAR
jgi:hypothetical protein